MSNALGEIRLIYQGTCARDETGMSVSTTVRASWMPHRFPLTSERGATLLRWVLLPPRSTATATIAAHVPSP